MAKSGSFSNNYRGWTLRTDWSSSQDIANNQSTIYCNHYLVCASGYGLDISARNNTNTIDGTELSFRSPAIDTSGGTTINLGSTSRTINHNNDGKKSFSMRTVFYMLATLSGVYVDNITAESGTIELPTIPRASTLTATNADIGSATSININRASDSFKHTLEYSFGNLTGTIASNINTSYGWTIPTEFYEEIPNSKSGECTITCKTYSGGSLIGTSTTKMTATANEELCRPQIDGIAVDTNMNTINLTGDATVIVRYFSSVQIDYSTEAKNSATIKNVYINNVEYNSSPATRVGSSVTTYELRVVDSRDYENIKVLTPSTIEYIPLTLNATFFRTAPTTGEVSLSFSGNYFDDIFGWEENNLNLRWAYRLKGDSVWTTGGTLTEGTDFLISNNTFHSGTSQYEDDIILGNEFDYRNAYEFIIYYSDKLINTFYQQSITKGQPIINWDDDHFNVNGEITQNEEPFISGGGDSLPVGTIVEYDGEEIPDGYTSLSADMLLVYTLYENSSGTQSAITLNDSVANYTYIEVIGRNNDGNIFSTGKLWDVNGKGFYMQSVGVNSAGRTWLKNTECRVNGNQITFNECYSESSLNGTALSVSHSNYNFITKVIGYK